MPNTFFSWRRTMLAVAFGAVQRMSSGKRFTIVQIETHNECTRKCWFCKFSQKRQDPELLQMPDSVFDRIVGELGAARFAGRISLYGINEPLMDARLRDRIEKIRKVCPHAFLSIDTNGDLLTTEIIKQFEAAGLDAMMINAYDTPALERAFRYERERIVTVSDFRQAEGRVENRGGSILRKTESFGKALQDRGCERPFRSLQIRANGDVVLCCADMYGDVVAGNVREATLEQLWNSAKFVNVRNRLRKRGRRDLPLCETCSHDGTASLRVPLNIRKSALRKWAREKGALLTLYLRRGLTFW